ncbi:hypothetical protein [Rubripirellula tenax]|nr:hypothetical protein [Rubripirellula tenax]
MRFSVKSLLLFTMLFGAVLMFTGCGGSDEPTVIQGDNTAIQKEQEARQQSYSEAMSKADKAGPGN